MDNEVAEYIGALEAIIAKLLAALEAVVDSFGRKLDATLTADEVEALTQVAAAIEEAKK